MLLQQWSLQGSDVVGKRANTLNMSFTFFFLYVSNMRCKNSTGCSLQELLSFMVFPLSLHKFYALMKRDDLITLLPCRVTLKLSLIEVCPICFPSRKLTFEESLFSINSTKSIKFIMHNENPNRVHWLPTQDYSQFLILNVWDQSQFNELTERRKYGTNSSY